VNIEELIKNMSIRPRMYVLSVKVEVIDSFIRGFLYSDRIRYDNYVFDYASADCVFASFFDKWVFQWVINNINKDYKLESLSWTVMLKSVTKDEDEAVKLFFLLSDIFFQCFHEKAPDYWEGISY